MNFTASGGLRSAHRRAVEHVPPLHDIAVTLRLPPGWTSSHARLVRAGRTVPVVQDGDRLAFTVPEVREFESIEVRRGS